MLLHKSLEFRLTLEKYFRKPLKNKKTDGLNLSFKPSVPGGEGLCLPNCKFFFTIPVTIEMILYRSREIEDLLHINNVPF